MKHFQISQLDGYPLQRPDQVLGFATAGANEDPVPAPDGLRRPLPLHPRDLVHGRDLGDLAQHRNRRDRRMKQVDLLLLEQGRQDPLAPEIRRVLILQVQQPEVVGQVEGKPDRPT